MLKRFYEHRILIIICVVILATVLVLGLYFRPRTLESFSPAPVYRTDGYCHSVYGNFNLTAEMQGKIVTLLKSCTVCRAPGKHGSDYRIAIYDDSGADIAELTFGETGEDCSIYIRTDGIELTRFILTKRSDKEAFSELYEQLELLSGR